MKPAVAGRGELSPKWVLTIVCLGVFSTALDQTVVVTALPSVMADLKLEVLTEADKASWIITGYLIGYTVAMPLLGRISDVYGYPRMYQIALVLFSVGSGLVAVAHSLPWMVGARVVQAVGGGATVPISMALAAAAMPPGKRGIGIGLVGAAAEAGSMLGPLYGGAIIHWIGWRWIFWIDIPQSAILFVSLWLLTNRRDRSIKVDYVGGVLLAIALTVLTIALSRRETFAVSSAVPYLVAGAGLVAVAAFVLVERRQRYPLIAIFLLRSRSFIAANVTQLFLGVALIMALVNVPLMANTVMGKGPLEGGLHLMRLTGSISVGALAGGYLLMRARVRNTSLAGLALIAVGFFAMSTWQAEINEAWLTLPLVTAGLGFGLVIAPINTTALSAVAEEYWATAASVVTVSRMIGMALGLAALSAWGMEHFQGLTAGLDFSQTAELPRELTEAGELLFRDFFRVAGGIALVAAIPTLGLKLARARPSPV